MGNALSPNAFQKVNDFFKQFAPLQYKKGDILLRIDDVPSHVFYIKKGYVRAYRISEQGDELTLLLLKENDFFPFCIGNMHIPANSYLEALTSLEVWSAPLANFEEFIKENPDVYYELSNSIFAKYLGLLTRMEYLVWSRAYIKVAATLLTCAKRFGEPQGNDTILRIPLTHKDIATLVGITRETASLEMKKLERKGIISRFGRLFVIKDMKQLEREALLHNEQDVLLRNFL
jgi:CRP/FNR family transcriptional regulator, cyclic AMP receptor protein